jgi:HAD superfamily hydrolase (TIGR01509 family)
VNQIKTVLFDLGNVIAHIDFGAFWRSLGFVKPEEIVPFAKGYKLLTLQYETGNIVTEDYLHGLQAVFNNWFTLIQLEQAFSNIMEEPVEGMLEKIKQISRTYRTALVSNTNEIHYQWSLKNYEALRILHNHYLSFQLRVMKPASGFYEAIIKCQGINPSEILFIDDIAENVEAAKVFGMEAVKFESMEQLEVTLKELGVC